MLGQRKSSERQTREPTNGAALSARSRSADDG
jgi:hypothetical protein